MKDITKKTITIGAAILVVSVSLALPQTILAKEHCPEAIEAKRLAPGTENKVLCLENQYPRIPLPNLPLGGKGPFSLNDIAARAKELATVPPLSAFVLYAFSFAVTVVGLIAFGAVLYAGVMFMMSGARPPMRAAAMNRLRNVILGIALLLGSVIVLNTINPELSIIQDPGATGGVLNFALPQVKLANNAYPCGTPGVAGPTVSGTEILSFDLKVEPSLIEPGGTVRLFWCAPEGVKYCVAYSSPLPIEGWGRGQVETIPGALGGGPSQGRLVPINSTVNGYALPIPANQKEDAYTLNISCAGGNTRAMASATLEVSKLSPDAIAKIPKATVDLKLQKTGDSFPKDLVVLSPKELRPPYTSGTFFYTVQGPAIDQGTIGSCTLEGGGGQEIFSNKLRGGTITVEELGISWLILGDYTFSCKDKKTNLEIGRDTVGVVTAEMLAPF